MPTYEYVCRSCGRHTEAVQSFSDDPLTVCPHCGGELRKVFGNVGIVLKGSGFYKTDSRAADSASAAAAKGKSDAKSESSGGSGDPGSKETSTPASASPAPAAATAPSSTASSSTGSSAD